MDSGLNAVVHFQVKLGKLVVLIGTGLLDISQTGGIDNVSDDKALNGLILRDRLASRHTADTLHVAAAVLVSSVVASLDSHCKYTVNKG